jgi:hypothetical protein
MATRVRVNAHLLRGDYKQADYGSVILPMIALALLTACAHEQRGPEPAPIAVSLPSPAMGPMEAPGWKTPLGAYGPERNRCIDRELARRDLNEFGDPKGTMYPEGAPLGVTKGTDRYEFVVRHRPDIGVTCTRPLGEPAR